MVRGFYNYCKIQHIHTILNLNILRSTPPLRERDSLHKTFYMVDFDTKKDNFLLLFKKHHPSMRPSTISGLTQGPLAGGMKWLLSQYGNC